MYDASEVSFVQRYRALLASLVALCALAAGASGSGSPGGQREPDRPLDILFILNFPVLTDFTVSPDGTHVSVSGHRFGKQKIWVVPGSEETGYILAETEARDRDPDWSPDGKEIVFSSDRAGGWNLFAVRLEDQAVRRLTFSEREDRLPRWSPDGRHVAYLSRGAAGETGWDVWLAPAQPPGGSPRRLSEHSLDEEDPRWSPDGKWIAYTYGGGQHQDRRIAIVSARSDADLERRELLPKDWSGDVHSPRWSPDGKTMAFVSDGEGIASVYVASTNGSTPPRRVAPSELAQTDPAWSPDGNEIVYVRNEEGELRLFLASVDSGETRRLTLASGVYAHPRFDATGEGVFSFYEGPTYPRDVWFYGKNGERRRLTETLFAVLDVRQMVRPERVSYTSLDGRRITGFLYLPRAIGPEAPVPLIVHPHDGPSEQWQDGWHPFVQLLAQQGYAVLLPNVRGSTGFGRDFEDANDRDWGRGDVDDLVAGTRELTARPEIRSDSVGIWGVGYGGFLALAATIRYPDTYAAAVEALAMPDLAAMYRETTAEGRSLLERELGPLRGNREVYEELSLHTRTSAIKTPLLSFHGEDYPLVPYLPVKRPFIEALQQRRFPLTEFVFREDMGRATRFYYLYPAPTNFYMEKMLELWETLLS